MLAARITRPGRSRAVHGAILATFDPGRPGKLPASAARMVRREAPRDRRRP